MHGWDETAATDDPTLDAPALVTFLEERIATCKAPVKVVFDPSSTSKAIGEKEVVAGLVVQTTDAASRRGTSYTKLRSHLEPPTVVSEIPNKERGQQVKQSQQDREKEAHLVIVEIDVADQVG